MKAIKLKKLFSEFSYSGNINVKFNRVEIDSRKVRKGDLFVAMKGTRFDSHRKIPEAINRGAVGVVHENDVKLPENIVSVKVKDSRSAYAKISSSFFNFPSKRLKLVGITGTSGKTTTAYILYSFFNELGFKSGFLGTMGEDMGEGFILKEKFPPTTPDAFYLNNILSKMVNNGIKFAFVEVSSSAVLFKRIEGLSFYKKILTNISIDHLDVHGTFQNYLDCKVKFFRGNIPTILNSDSRFVERFVSVSKSFKTYGVKNKADYMAVVKGIYSQGMTIALDYCKNSTSIFLNAKGEFNLYNFLALVAFAAEEGVSIGKIKDFAERLPEVPGRMNIINTGKGIIIIDFAHNPDEIKAVLKYANQIKKNRLITVSGAVGWSTKEKRASIGSLNSSSSDVFILTTDDPRGDDADEIIEDVRVGAHKKNILIIKDRFAAIKNAISMMRDGDIVAILGRGEEREIHFKNKTVVKGDAEYVKEILDED